MHRVWHVTPCTETDGPRLWECPAIRTDWILSAADMVRIDLTTPRIYNT